MNDIVIIKPHCIDNDKTERLNNVLYKGLKNYKYLTIHEDEALKNADLKNKKIIFAISLGESGINLEFYSMLKIIRISPHMFDGSVGGIIIDGSSELYTKNISRELVFSANNSGCAFPGRPLVEGTKFLKNYNIIAKNLNTDNIGAYIESSKDLIERVIHFKKNKKDYPNLLVLHSGNATTSNTLSLWRMVKSSLKCNITEISLRDGEVWDCRGCSYETCLHLGEEEKCFYGGIITHQVYPAIMKCDGLVMICPNYNDAIGANLTAFVNRLTAIFRVHRFYEKRLFGIIVSGYSGSDIVAQQLISGLNMNKTFMLPPKFVMMETANDPKTVTNLEGIRERAAQFGKSIMEEFQGCQSIEK